jgi:phage-related protein
MTSRFKVIFLDEAIEFLKTLEIKHYQKIIYNVRRAQTEKDPELFKKLDGEIWEFRTLYKGFHYRFLAFWDKSDSQSTFVITTHGFIKKRSDVPDKEIQKSQQLRIKYFESKDPNNKRSK